MELMGCDEATAKAMMKTRAKKVGEKKSAEELQEEKEAYEVSSGQAELRANILIQEKVKTLERRNRNSTRRGVEDRRLKRKSSRERRR